MESTSLHAFALPFHRSIERRGAQQYR